MAVRQVVSKSDLAKIALVPTAALFTSWPAVAVFGALTAVALNTAASSRSAPSQLPFSEDQLDLSECHHRMNLWRPGPDIRLAIEVRGRLAYQLYRYFFSHVDVKPDKSKEPYGLRHAFWVGHSAECHMEIRPENRFRPFCQLHAFNLDPRYNFPRVQTPFSIGGWWSNLAITHNGDRVRVRSFGEASAALARALADNPVARQSRLLHCDASKDYCEFELILPLSEETRVRFSPIDPVYNTDSDFACDALTSLTS